MTNPVSSVTVERNASILPYGANDTLSTSGSNDFLYFGLNVTDNAPSDLPW